MGDLGEFTIFFRKKIEPFLAVGIIIMLVLLVTFQVREHNTTKLIKENCGWEEDERYYCYCDKSDVEEIEIKLNPQIYSSEDFNYIGENNVSLAR